MLQIVMMEIESKTTKAMMEGLGICHPQLNSSFSRANDGLGELVRRLKN
jgi:hypothetical protein